MVPHGGLRVLCPGRTNSRYVFVWWSPGAVALMYSTMVNGTLDQRSFG
jgi:hypothetical protein